MRLRRLLTLALGGGVAALVVWGAGDRIAHGQTFRVNEVRFSGQVETSAAQLRHLTNIRTGSHMFQTDLNRAVHGVEQHPWVETASARRRFPGTVEVTVTEHTPEMLVALDALWYADARGHVFKQADPGRLDFPILTGLDPKLLDEQPELGRQIVTRAFGVLQTVREHPSIADEDISELNFETHRGFSLVLRNGSRVVLGFNTPVPLLDRLAQMVTLGLDLNEPQVIDLDIDSVAVVTPL